MEERSKTIMSLLMAFPQVNGKSTDQITAMVASYADALDDQPPEVLSVACKQIRRTSKFIPTIAEILEICISLTHERLPDVADAWQVARRWCAAHERYADLSRYGTVCELRAGNANTPVSFEEWASTPRNVHPAIIDACKVLGISRIFNTPEDDAFISKEFASTYGVVQARVQRHALESPQVRNMLSAVVAARRAPELPAPVLPGQVRA